MAANNIINRIKNVFKKEKQKKKDLRKRKLCFEHLESKELLAVVSLGGSSYSITESPIFEAGYGCSPGCSPSCRMEYSYSHCGSGKIYSGYADIPVNVDLSNHPSTKSPK